MTGQIPHPDVDLLADAVAQRLGYQSAIDMSIYKWDLALQLHEVLRAAVDVLAEAGRLLPAGTETVEQYGTRVYRDGQLIAEADSPVTRERAQQRVDLHTREREQDPGWTGHAVLVRRHQHATPWTPVEETP